MNGMKKFGITTLGVATLAMGVGVSVHADGMSQANLGKAVKKGHKLQVTAKTIKVYQVKKSNQKVVKTFKLSKNSVVKVGAKVKALNGHRIIIKSKTLKASQMYVTPAKQFTYDTKTTNLTAKQHALVLQASHKWAKKLTKPQKKAIYHYTSDGYKDINSYLRNLIPGTKQVKGEVGKIDRGLNKFAMPLNVTVWRGTSVQSIGYGVKGGQIKVGARYSDQAYMSTSFDREIANSFNSDAILKIQLPAGKYGAAIAPLSDYQSEDEFLVKHGAKMIVTGVDKKKSKTVVTLNFVK
ncbi:ADP-ribosyltransferase [Periweissella cryptocerci]|nr:ADP-ribosyltransferase [Periweissella cryptocerci]